MFRVPQQGPKHLALRCSWCVIEKVMKRRYRKWPRIGHLNICSPSYGQKRGRESNCQFDSRPLKVGNRPFPTCELRVRYVVAKISARATSLVRRRRDQTSQSGVMSSQSPGTPPGTVSGQFRDSNPGNPRVPGVPGKSDIWAWVSRSVTEYTIGSKVVAYSRVRAVVCLVVQSARGWSQHPRVSQNVN
jgi:hypothetical protein